MNIVVFFQLCLENILKLQIMEEHDDGCETRTYSLEDLRELQNKLMLMSGKGDQGQCEVDQFAEVSFELFHSVKFHHAIVIIPELSSSLFPGICQCTEVGLCFY